MINRWGEYTHSQFILQFIGGVVIVAVMVSLTFFGLTLSRHQVEGDRLVIQQLQMETEATRKDLDEAVAEFRLGFIAQNHMICAIAHKDNVKLGIAARKICRG